MRRSLMIKLKVFRMAEGRFQEWYVPKAGPMWLRAVIGLSFWPYTLLCASLPVIGSMFAPIIHWDRVGAIFIIYVLALGIGAHALDARGENKPWGKHLSNGTLLILSILSLASAMIIGFYYILTAAPLLFILALAELWFVFAYNLEIRHGYFHTDGWFAISWGGLPPIAGYMIQNGLNPVIIWLLFAFGFASAAVEINASRPYRAIKRGQIINDYITIKHYQKALEAIVILIVALALLLIENRLGA
jgi:succinate dehydrogenase hydrophobic anchor subunit